MRSEIAPIIAKLNTIIVENEVGLDPLAEHDAEAMRLIGFAKDLLTRAIAALIRAEMERTRED